MASGYKTLQDGLIRQEGEYFCVSVTTFDVVARLDRAIQYSRAFVMKSRERGVLDTPPSRGMTTKPLLQLRRRGAVEYLALRALKQIERVGFDRQRPALSR
jgi:hypothetical protein